MLQTGTHKRIYSFLFLLLAFCLPIYDRLVAIVLALIMLNWITEWNFKEKYQRVTRSKKRKLLLSFSLLYIAYLLGMLYSSNFDYGSFDLEVKLSLLLFPVLFSTLDEGIFDKRFVMRLLYLYLAGCVMITIVVLINSFLNYTQSNSLVEFYYLNLAAFQHPSYFSMNLNMAVAIIIYILVKHRKEVTRPLIIAMIIMVPFFFAMIMLLSSKAGIISLLFILVISILSVIFFRKAYFQGILLLIMIPVFITAAYFLFPRAFIRLNQARESFINPMQANSANLDGTSERLLIWKTSLLVIRENPVIGVGTGDVKDVLIEKYKESGNENAVTLQLNAHNQYLQTAVALGGIGLIILVTSIIAPLILSIRRRNLLYFLFLVIVAFNLLVESMLERQAGVVFYSFFNAFLFFVREEGE